MTLMLEVWARMGVRAIAVPAAWAWRVCIHISAWGEAPRRIGRSGMGERRSGERAERVRLRWAESVSIVLSVCG